MPSSLSLPNVGSLRIGVRDVDGRVLSKGTFACVAVIPPRFNMWLAAIEPILHIFKTRGDGLQTGEAIAACSLLIGLTGFLTHQFLRTTASTGLSLWALKPPNASDSQSAVSTPAANPPPPRCRQSAVSELAHAVQRNLVEEQRWRIAHALFVGVFCIVDVLFNGALYFEVIVLPIFVVPYRLFTLGVMAYLLAAGVVKTTIVAGRQRGLWLEAFPCVRSTRAPHARYLRLCRCRRSDHRLSLNFKFGCR